MNTVTLLITPEFAASMIEEAPFNPRFPGKPNKKIDYAHSRTFVDAIKSGQFVTMANGIQIDEAGVLVDGFHRLHAVRATGESVEMRVTYGVRRETVPLIDYGVRSRGASSVLNCSVRDAQTVMVICDVVFGDIKSTMLAKRVFEAIKHACDDATRFYISSPKLFGGAAMRASAVLSHMARNDSALALYKAMAMTRPEDHCKVSIGLRAFSGVRATDRREIMVRAWKLFTCGDDAKIIRYMGTQEELDQFRAYAKSILRGNGMEIA